MKIIFGWSSFESIYDSPTLNLIWLLLLKLEISLFKIYFFFSRRNWLLFKLNIHYNISNDYDISPTNKRLLHDIFHIGPGISPILPYQARQRSWSADMGRGLIPGTIWKISCHNLFITYFTLTFSKHWLLYCKKDLWTDKLQSLRELPLYNLQILLFRIWFQKYTKQCRSVQWR